MIIIWLSKHAEIVFVTVFRWLVLAILYFLVYVLLVYKVHEDYLAAMDALLVGTIINIRDCIYVNFISKREFIKKLYRHKCHFHSKQLQYIFSINLLFRPELFLRCVRSINSGNGNLINSGTLEISSVLRILNIRQKYDDRIFSNPSAF